MTTQSRRDESDAAFRVLSTSPDRSGRVVLLLAGPTDARLEFGFVDSRGVTHPVPPRSVRRSTLADVNLVAVEGATTGWALDSRSKAALDRNLAEWSLPAEDTVYIRTGVAEAGGGAVVATASLVDPLTGGTTPVRPGVTYRLSLLVATHRCTAALRLEVLSADGEILLSERRDAGRDHKGGTDPARYERAGLDFTAPPGAAFAQISVEKGPTERKTSSYAFFARPELRDLSRMMGGEAAAFPAPVLEALRSGEPVSRVILTAPEEIFVDGPARCEIVVSGGCGSQRLGPLTLEKTAPPESGLVPASSHHLRALAAWAEHGGDVPADLAALHAELLNGPRRRDQYPPLAFPDVVDPEVSVVIPAHDEFEITYACLCALLFAFNRTSFEIIVVDDGSSDETARIGEIVSGISVVSHAAAQGLVQSCNDGAKIARGKYIAVLNKDTEVTSGWLDELVEVFASFDNVGLVGPKLLHPDGRLQAAGGIVRRNGEPEAVGRDANPGDPKYNYLRQVDFVPGAAMLLPRRLWEDLGGFSEDMAPAGLADADLAMKVWDAGRVVAYAPSATVFHFDAAAAPDESNLPKFKRKWARRFTAHGADGAPPDREQDRNAAFRVLYVDKRFPMVDSDAGGYSAFQEIRLLQAMRAKVSFLPQDLAWAGRHTLALQRIGVECLYAPYVSGFESHVREHAADYDAIYVCRYKLMERLVATVREMAPAARLILNLADLHFLRETREAAAGSTGYSYERALRTREAELAMVAAADLTFSYSDVEIALIQSNLGGKAQVARLPWVVDPPPTERPPFEDTRDLLFLGGFGHPPNVEAVKAFVRDVMPLLAQRLPGVRLTVVGSKAPPEILALASESVDVRGYLPSLDAVFDASRVFVAPLLAGAGIKGKVLEAMARGIPIVLSPVAMEGTGLADGVDCLVARTPQEWVEAVVRLYTDKALNTAVGAVARKAATTRFSFAHGVELIQDALAQIDLFAGAGPRLTYRFTRPKTYG